MTLAHVFLVRDGKMLVLRQASGWQWWGQPGGDVEDGETPAEAVMRETLEETGLRISEPSLLRTWSYQDRRGQETACFVYVIDAPVGDVRLSDEHTSYAWLDVEEFVSQYYGAELDRQLPVYAGFFAGMRENCELLRVWLAQRS